jgi:hypothetical protein
MAKKAGLSDIFGKRRNGVRAMLFTGCKTSCASEAQYCFDDRFLNDREIFFLRFSAIQGAMMS